MIPSGLFMERTVIVNSWFYQLQNIKVDAVAKIKADIKVIDYSRDGSHEGRFSLSEVDTMRGYPPGWVFGSKASHSIPLVLAYMSIGEAETYRWYWDKAWDFKKPYWMDKENPNWGSNYKVRYWDQEWQGLIIQYLDRIIDAGFDGVYLDIIDAFEYWETLGVENAEEQMVKFVRKISAHASHRRPNFWVVPQNGERLLKNREYVSAINAIAKEDLLFGSESDGQPNSLYEIKEAHSLLAYAKAHALPVLLVEYVNTKGQIKQVMNVAQIEGYVPLIARRLLDTEE